MLMHAATASAHGTGGPGGIGPSPVPVPPVPRAMPCTGRCQPHWHDASPTGMMPVGRMASVGLGFGLRPLHLVPGAVAPPSPRHIVHARSGVLLRVPASQRGTRTLTPSSSLCSLSGQRPVASSNTTMEASAG
jgi:hypothetical protein